MSIINRSLLFVTPKEPLHAWIRALDPNHDGERAGTIVGYMIPPIDEWEDEEKILRQVWPIVFEQELESRWKNEADWPTPRTLGLFREFFVVAFCPIVDDLCGWEIEPEEWDSPDDD